MRTAEKIVQELRHGLENYKGSVDAKIMREVTLLIRTAKSDAFRAGAEWMREEAAKAAEDHRWARDVSWWLVATKHEISVVSAQEAASAIRAITIKEPNNG